MEVGGFGDHRIPPQKDFLREWGSLSAFFRRGIKGAGSPEGNCFAT